MKNKRKFIGYLMMTMFFIALIAILISVMGLKIAAITVIGACLMTWWVNKAIDLII